MFTLLTPSALLALLGLLVPVAIHLWNRRPGREVAVGSLRWLAAGANRRLRNLKLEQRWLLLLRAALLAVLALALAGPAWRQALPAGRGQVLLSPDVLGTPAFAALRPTVDSLRRRGYALRWLAAGFPYVTGAAWRADLLGRRDSLRLRAAAGSVAAGRLLWARVQQAAGAFAGQPLYVVTPAALRGFEGAHPALDPRITWQTLPNPTTNTWLQAATVRADSLELLLGRSTETQTTFGRKAAVRPQTDQLVRLAGLPPLRFATGAAGSQLVPVSAAASSEHSAPAIAVRTRPLRVLLYSTPNYAADARFLRAGLRAAAAGLASPLVLDAVNAAPKPATRPDWLFWLSDAPLPAAWRTAVQQGTRVWQEPAGPGVADEARLVAAAGEAPSTILRRGASPATAGSLPLWSDGLGRAVLTRQALGRGAVYQLHTRLNPTWSDLADNPSLPARLLALLQPEEADADAPAASASDQALAAQDRRALDAAQLPAPPETKNAGRTAARSTKAKAAPSNSRVTELRPWLVLAVGVLFALERLLARRREMRAISLAS